MMRRLMGRQSDLSLDCSSLGISPTASYFSKTRMIFLIEEDLHFPPIFWVLWARKNPKQSDSPMTYVFFWDTASQCLPARLPHLYGVKIDKSGVVAGNRSRENQRKGLVHFVLCLDAWPWTSHWGSISLNSIHTEKARVAEATDMDRAGSLGGRLAL